MPNGARHDALQEEDAGEPAGDTSADGGRTHDFPNRQHPACASSNLSETTSKLSCLFLDVFDEPGDVQPVDQRVMEIDEER